MRKQLFLRRLLVRRDEWEVLINRVGFARLNAMPGVVGQWSVKDLLAQVMAYEQYIADRVSEIAHGESYQPAQSQPQLDLFLARFGCPDFQSPLLSVNGANAWVVEKYRNVSMEEVAAQEMNAFHALFTGLEALSEEQLRQHRLYARVAENTCEHYQQHARAIETWLVNVKS